MYVNNDDEEYEPETIYFLSSDPDDQVNNLEYSYVDFVHDPNDQYDNNKLSNGDKLPSRVYFKNVEYDTEENFFSGTVSFYPHTMNNTVQSIRYEITFESNFEI